MATKHEMLSRIRAALGREQDSAPPALAPFGSTKADVGEDLSDRFCAELERVGGQVRRVGSPGEIKSYLETLLVGDSPTVALSDSAAAEAMGLRKWLCGRGVAVLGSYKEFVAASALGSDSAGSTSGDGAGAAPVSGVREEYKRALLSVSVGVTSADYAIADTGTLVLVSGAEQHRMISLVPPVHVCLLEAGHLVANLEELLSRVGSDGYSKDPPPQAMTFITGPSRTADIELSLTLGVHGPRELHLLLLDPSTLAGLTGSN